MPEPFSALWAAVYPPTTATDDIAVRKAVLDELDQTLFVEAGAGSGKTTILVARVVALVASGIPLTAIAAITFTEKAATELRDRIRHELAAVANHPAANAIISARCREALDEIDSAAIGTLHAFAQRLLGEHPLEASLPPRLEVLDEISSEVAFEDRWRAWRDELLEDPAMAETIVLALASRVRLEHVRDLATVFQDNWDLVAERVDESPPTPAPLDISSTVTELRDVCRERSLSRDPEDLLALRLADIERWLERLDGATDDADRIGLIAGRPSMAVGSRGQKKNWPDIATVRQRVVAVSEQFDRAVAAIQHACLVHLAGALARFTRDSVESRRVEGRLEFHDLLVFARRLLRDHEHGARVRALARDRYQRLLLDEFQDTDPIQIELAVRLAAPADASGADWRELTPEPGRLFFVGDPKQSIYRFRRADIELFLEAADRFGPSRPLTANFRSTAPVVEWINHVFGRLIQAVPGEQPAYLPLRAVRRGGRKGPHVVTLGNKAHVAADGERFSADDLRAFEVDDVAAVIMTIVRDRWPVGDELKDARLGDITVLLPARTALPALERAFEHAGIAFRAVSGSLVYTTPEVRDLLLAARAIDDPTDELALVATLRSRLFGCTDVDLFEFRNTFGGRWNHQAPLPASLPAGHPVGDAIAELSDLAKKARWIAPSELLDDLMRRRRLMELGLVGSRARDLWRRLRFVVDQARAWSEAGGTSLRAYLEWATRQATEGTRVAEAVLPETDDDAVQVMTIHAAKGLQFPITIVAGLTTEPRARQDGATVLWAGGGCEIKVGPGVKTARYDELAELDEQLGHHERLRLLYVACTRAQDHLVISTHRRVRKNTDVEREKLTLAELVALASEDSSARPFRAPAQRALPLAPADYSGVVPFEFGDPEQWAAELARVLATGRRTSTVAATALAALIPDDDPGLAKEPRDLDLPAWNRGRYGTAIGKAVHGVLQTIDLTSGEPLAATAAAQAAAEGVLGREGVVAALVRSALASATVQRAASRRHWREVYVASPIGGVTLEGYVDLLYRDEGGLVVVDFKTDQVSAADLETRLDHYRLQTAAYAVAIEHTTGETVDRCELLFLKSEGAALVHIIVDLDDAKAEVLARLGAFSVR
ncbi:MAG: UvrD-helicase domain-containing protein [Acidimicrobiales bacterium]